MLHWVMDGIEAAPLELSTEGHRRASEPGLVIHRADSLSRDMVRHEGLQVTTVARTLVDVAAMIPPSALELGYESARRKGLVTDEEILEVLDRLGERRRGRAVLLRLLESVPAEATESALETLAWQLFRELELPLPVRQMVIRNTKGAVVARPDFVYPDARLVVEADGKRFHSDWYRDHRRQMILTRLGWLVYRLAWRDLRDRPGEVAAEIAEMYALGLARIASLPTTTVQ